MFRFSAVFVFVVVGILVYTNRVMNRQKLFMIIGMLVCATIPLSATNLKVDFLDGKLEYREKQGDWQQLYIGDVIPRDCSIRLSNHGFAELTTDGRRVTLTQAGIYASFELIGNNPKKGNLRQIIGSKFSTLIIRNPNDTHNTAAAVRAAALDSDDFITWEDESANYLEDGLGLMEAGDFIGARETFKKGSLWESGAAQRECIFRHGIAEQILGNPKLARKALMAVNPTEDDSFLGEYTIMMAIMYLESMEYEQADKTISNYLLTNPSDEDATQAAWLLSAYSLAGLGEDSEVSLKKAIELGPGNEIGMAAADMLK